MKICSKCKNEKSLLLFNKCLAKKDGLMNWCKECVRTYDQKRFPSFYALNKEKILSKQNTARRNNLEAYLLSSAKARAKRKKIEFNLDIGDINIPEFCPILNIKLESKIGNSGAANNSPSLDRIDPNKGYTKDNIEVISYRANTLKNNGTIEEHTLVLQYMIKDLK